MRTDQLLEISPRAMGATWLPGSRSELLKKKFPRTIERVRQRAEFVADKIARLSVVELGGIATALLVKREAPKADGEERIARLRKIKPQLSVGDAHAAVDTVDRWEEEAPF